MRRIWETIAEIPPGCVANYGQVAPFRRQRDLLAREGVVMFGGRVDMNKYRWQPGLDELLWKPTSMWDEE